MVLAVDKVEQLLDLLQELDETTMENQLSEFYSDTYENGLEGGPYAWQEEFHNMGFNHRERAIIAGNRVGKTRTAAAEVAIHLTGLYPPWWKGKQFTQPTDWIVAAPTNELCRDILQLALVGNMREGEKAPDGKGWIPASCIQDFGWRQCGVANVMDTLRVKHVSGGTSLCTFKSYEQGPVKFQGVARDGVWLDEEPKDYEIYTESLTRTLDKNGMVIFSRTPLFGMSDIIEHYVKGGNGIYFKNVTWDDAPHLDEEAKADLLSSYPEHERDTRAKGVPMMGSGNVYNVPDEMIMCEPFEIPEHFRRICGIDFGIDHPAAACWIAYDADADVVYVYDCYKERGQTAAYHSQAIMSRGKWIPVSWPHDGMVRDKGGGVALKEQYQSQGVNMLGFSARYDDAKGGGQSREPITLEILERMRTGRFRVFNHLNEWFEEKRMLHRKDGKINPVKDDIESATRYAVMMLRCSTNYVDEFTTRQSSVNYDNYSPLQDY
jgi:phage terminase large subunit-like protein|tara:strand:- start:219 stop:1694 length:1476 start_codon:yes stop_codon:yes gene_type:complete